MRKRTLAREFALQVLYQIDITGDAPESALQNFWKAHEDVSIEEETRLFTEKIVTGLAASLKEIDATISSYATNWQLARMAVVDRNILRMGCFELTCLDDIPPKVAINEAIELAKKYSTQDAAKFVNGVLDKIKIENDK